MLQAMKKGFLPIATALSLARAGLDPVVAHTAPWSVCEIRLDKMDAQACWRPRREFDRSLPWRRSQLFCAMVDAGQAFDCA